MFYNCISLISFRIIYNWYIAYSNHGQEKNWIPKFYDTKDYDSYNDYIIKIDNIMGIDNSDLDIKDNQEDDKNENEATNNHIKDKEESFTNY